MTFLPEPEGLKDGDFYVPPFDDMPLAGRPAQPMAICKDIYDHVELDIDGSRVGKGAITLKSGSTVQVKGAIFANTSLDPRVAMDGGLGLVSRSKNKRGWTVRWHAFYGGHTGGGCCTFEGKYVVPKAPGEYILVVISSAHVGPVDHPLLLAAEYQAVVE
jgi:hypothetical protein